MGKDSEKGEYKSPEGSHTWEYLATFCCTMFSLSFGTVVGWNSPGLSKLMAADSPIVVTPSDASTMAAMVALGHTMGPPLTMLMMDKLGRKTSLLITGIPFVVSWGLIAVAKHVMVLFVARFICGLSVGLGMCVRPMYLGEISSPRLRGGVGMISEIMFNTGVLFAMALMPYLTVRVSACVFFAVALSFLISFSFMPESPYFLTLVGRTDAAKSSLEKLRGKTDVSDEMELIKKTLLHRGKFTLIETTDGIDNEKSPAKDLSSFKQLCTISGNRKSLFIMLLFSFSHQFGGFVTLMTYGHLIFNAVGDVLDTHISMIIVAILQLIVSIITSLLVDKLGRIPLLFFSGFISGICLIIVGGYLYLIEYMNADVKQYAIIPFLALFLLVVAANVGLMPLQTVVISEILDTDIKALASCVFGVVGGLMSTFSAKCYLVIAVTWGLGHSVPLLFFAPMTWISTALLIWLLPETKGKTFLQIQKDLNA